MAMDESLENSAFLEQNYQSGFSMYSDGLKEEQSPSFRMHGFTDSLGPTVVYSKLYDYHRGDDIPYEKRFFFYQRSERLINLVNELLSSRPEYTSYVFHRSKQYWDVVTLSPWAYLWCRIFFRDHPNNDVDCLAVEIRLVEGDSEELHDLAIRLQQKLLPFHSVGDNSLFHQWYQSISGPDEDPYGFTNNGDTATSVLDAIRTLQNIKGDVTVGEKLGAVRTILAAVRNNTELLINEGLVEAMLTLFTSSRSSDPLNDPYLLKPYAVQILHAVLETNPEVRSKLAANNNFMHFLSTVTQSNAEMLLTRVLQQCKEMDDLIVLARKRSLKEDDSSITNKK